MPIVAMHDVGTPVRVGAARQRRGHPAQHCETPVVVAPVTAVGRDVGTAGPVVESRVIDDIGRDITLSGSAPRAQAGAFDRERCLQPDATSVKPE